MTPTIADLETEIARLQSLLDTERATPLGRAAFYHRHRALAYVRQRDPALYQEATNAALREIDRDGGISFEDVVAALEQDCDYWRAYASAAEQQAADLATRIGGCEADAAALRAVLLEVAAFFGPPSDLADRGTGELAERVIRALDARAGRTLLAQWGAARALAAWLNDTRHWTCGNCPCCGFGLTVHGTVYHGMGCVLNTYNQLEETSERTTERL